MMRANHKHIRANEYKQNELLTYDNRGIKQKTQRSKCFTQRIKCSARLMFHGILISTRKFDEHDVAPIGLTSKRVRKVNVKKILSGVFAPTKTRSQATTLLVHCE